MNANDTIESILARITHDTRVWLSGHDRRAKAWAQPFLRVATRPAAGPIDFAIITPRTLDEGQYLAEKVGARLAPQGQIILIWTEHRDETPATIDYNEIALRFGRCGWVASQEVSVVPQKTTSREAARIERPTVVPPGLHAMTFRRAASEPAIADPGSATVI